MRTRPVNWMDNPNADRVKRVAQLAGRSAVRNRRQRFLAEGPQSATEAIRAHLGLLDLSAQTAQFWPKDHTVAEVYYTQRLSSSHPELAGYIGKITGDVFVAEASDEVMQAMSDAVVHQNIIVVAHLPRVDLKPTPDAQLVASMVRVQDPGNAGTIIRTADAAGVDYVIATQRSVDVYNPKTVRSSAGSLFHVPVYTNIDLREFVAAYQGRVFAADGYGDLSLDEAPAAALMQATAWLFGNEAQGLDTDERDLADQRVSVPLYGRAESLNVATAATICLYSSAMAQRGG
ncbi:MAG: RNA methyltransferase [Micrococcaceae bacterium]|nr:RNA methyltransferase [Micrococcaceae bacterium]